MPGPFWEYDTSGSDHLRPCVDPRRRGGYDAAVQMAETAGRVGLHRRRVPV